MNGPSYKNPARILQQTRAQATRRSEQHRLRVQARMQREQDRMARSAPQHVTSTNEEH